jgi:hypothetical protein
MAVGHIVKWLKENPNIDQSAFRGGCAPSDAEMGM